MSPAISIRQKSISSKSIYQKIDKSYRFLNMDDGVAFSVFEAQADGEGWKVTSEINDSAKLDILERFVEAEEAVLTDVATHSTPPLEPEKGTNKDLSLFL